MDNRLSREKLIEALKAENVNFPDDASVRHLRSLYNDLMNKSTGNNADAANDLIPLHNEDNKSELGASSEEIQAFNTCKTDQGILNSAVTPYSATAITSFSNIGAAEIALSAAAAMMIPKVTAVQGPPADTATVLTTSVSAANTPVSTATAVMMSSSSAANNPCNTAVTTSADVIQVEEELRLLRMHREMLELKKQIEELESSNYTAAKEDRRIHFEELDAAVPKFSGKDHYGIKKWFIQFEDYTKASKIGKREQCLGVHRRLEGTTRDFAFNLGVVDYDELKTSLIDMFHRNVTRQEVYRQLKARPLKSNETCLSYVVAMQSIAAQSKIDEQELLDIIIDGIPDTSNAVSILYGATSISELVRQMDRYEQRRPKPNIIKGSTNTATMTASKPKTSTTKTPAAADKTEIRCFNCSQFGHFQSACPKPLRPPGSWFTCHQMGHMHKDCPKSKRNQPQYVAAVQWEGDTDAEEAMRVMQTPN